MKITLLGSVLFLCAGICACSSNTKTVVKDNMLTNAMSVEGRDIYLRGEMNDYGVISAYKLTKVRDNEFCTVAPLRSDWSPYRFKFADSAWSSGSNFGYAAPPGVLHENGQDIKLNPSSRFEELTFAPKEDGNYRFCIVIKKDGYYSHVSKSTEGLATLYELLFNNNNLFSKI